MKKFIICLFVILFLAGCSKITVPNIIDTDESVAKNILSSNGLIPSIKYEYDSSIQKGYVIRTEPEIGSKVKKNSSIIIYISNGPSLIESKNSNIKWYNVGRDMDNWEFYNPYIEDGVLKISCYNVKFTENIEWIDNNNYGSIIGNASINDTFDKVVPISAKYQKQSFNSYESQDFTLEIPLSELDVDKPTNMYVSLFANINGNFQEINVSFSMTW